MREVCIVLICKFMCRMGQAEGKLCDSTQVEGKPGGSLKDASLHCLPTPCLSLSKTFAQIRPSFANVQ